MDRVRCCERNGPFCDEGQAHDEVGNRRLPFFRRKFTFKDEHSQGNRQRRNHAADHDRSHDTRADSLTTGTHEGGRAKDVSRFVDRTAEVDGHHAAQDETENDAARCGHAIEDIEEPRIKNRSRRIDDISHNDADEDQTEDRIEEDGLRAVQGFRQMGQRFFQENDEVPCDEAGKEGAEETRTTCRCQETADDTGHEAGRSPILMAI